MSALNSGEANIEIISDDETAELLVFDQHNKVVAIDVGVLRRSVKHGVYRIENRVGYSTKSRLEVVRGSEVRVHFGATAFSSSAPLVDTAETHESHMGAAKNLSSKVTHTLGEGSQVFVFARVWRDQRNLHRFESASIPPTRFLSLSNSQNKLICEIEKFSEGEFDSGDARPWAACTIKIDPGTYLLKLETPEGELAQTIVTTPNWQTQVFLMNDGWWNKQGFDRVDLSSAAVFMSQNGFDPADKEKRLIELLSQGIEKRRPIVSEELRSQLLQHSYKDPILYLLAAHCHLFAEKPDKNFLEAMISYLREVLGTLHLDVESLALKLKLDSHISNFESPPMLRQSWNYITERNLELKSLFPKDSLSARVGGLLWSSESPWLQWLSPPHKPELEPRNNKDQAILSKSFNLPGPVVDNDVGSSQENNDDDSYRALASLYETTRTGESPGSKRTEAMTKIVEQVKAGSEAQGNIRILSRSPHEMTNGERLVCLAHLQGLPQSEGFALVLDGITQSRSAFEQYHALVAAEQLINALGNEQLKKLYAALLYQRSGGAYAYITEGTSRWALSSKTLESIKNRMAYSFILDILQDIAEEYEATRRNISSGFLRTRRMTDLVRYIHEWARQQRNGLELNSPTNLIKDNSDGRRIVALGYLQVYPSLDGYALIEDALTNSRSPFEQYQALIAVEKLREKELLDGKRKSQLNQVLSDVVRQLEGQQAVNRLRISRRLLKEVEEA